MKIYYIHLVLLIFSILFITTGQPQVKKMTIIPSTVVSTNMDELQKIERTRIINPIPEEREGPNIFPRQKPQEISTGGTDVMSNQLLVASPAPSVTFQAQADIPTFPQNYMWIPPDTWGAVGPTKIMSVHNNNVVIQDRAGNQLSLVSLQTFWSPLPLIMRYPYDPKVVYDPYNDRWIFVSMADPDTLTGALLVAISNTNDPSGAWTQYRYPLAQNIQGNDCWPDYPCIGFNKNWVAISVNMFTIGGGVFQESRIVVIDYPQLLALTLPNPITFIFTGIADFTIQPCITYSATEEKLYAPNSIWGTASYRLNTITGTASAPLWNMGVTKTHTVLSAWMGSLTMVLPQLRQSPDSTAENIDGDDDRINNAVFRNNMIYYSQTVGLPASNMTHTAAQWVVLDINANYLQGGRIVDPTATPTNGYWYAYPSINVNGYGDILVGFSRFSRWLPAASGYCYKDRTDALSSMRDPYIYKPGVSFYWQSFSESRNRWGDFSFVQPDPKDNYNFWTIQEYAAQNVGVGSFSGRWGTWWAKIPPVSPKTPVSLSLTLRIQGFTNAGTGLMVADTVRCIIKNGVSPYLKVDSVKVYINTNGQGTATLTNVLTGNNYYIVIKHRNAVETWSNIVNFPTYSPSYNFASAQNQAYGSNQVKVGTNWCLYSGDVNQDGIVDSGDMGIVDNDNAAYVSGYTSTDVNGDGIVDSGDLGLVDNNNAIYVGKIVPPGAPPPQTISTNNEENNYSSINYKLSSDANVNIALYNLTGQKSAEIILQNNAGNYLIDFNSSPLIKKLPFGTYICKMKAVDKISGSILINYRKMIAILK